MRQRGPHVAIGRGGELLDAPRGLLGQRCSRPLERGEREASGLVRERDGDVGAGREPLDERPLRRGEILESVRVDGTSVPRGEVAGHAVGRVAPLAIAVPAPEAFQLRAVRTEQVGELCIEVFRLDKPRLELRERGSQCLRVAREARCVPRDASQQQPALGVRKHSTVVAVAAGDAGEQVVERAHGAADERLAARDEIPLDALNLRPVRDDEHGLPRDVGRIAVEQESDLAGVRRPREQCQRHATQSRAEARRLMEAWLLRRGGLRPAAAARDRAAGLLAGTAVAEIGLARASSGIGVGDPHRRALLLLHLCSTHVAHENRLSSHYRLLFRRIAAKTSGMRSRKWTASEFTSLTAKRSPALFRRRPRAIPRSDSPRIRCNRAR